LRHHSESSVKNAQHILLPDQNRFCNKYLMYTRISTNLRTQVVSHPIRNTIHKYLQSLKQHKVSLLKQTEYQCFVSHQAIKRSIVQRLPERKNMLYHIQPWHSLGVILL
jgi:hypothetical protein